MIKQRSRLTNSQMYQLTLWIERNWAIFDAESTTAKALEASSELGFDVKPTSLHTAARWIGKTLPKAKRPNNSPQKIIVNEVLRLLSAANIDPSPELLGLLKR